MANYRGPPSRFCNNWVRLRYNGSLQTTPSRDHVVEQLLLKTANVKASDLLSFIGPSNHKEYEACFNTERSLKEFAHEFNNETDGKWKRWSMESPLELDVVSLTVRMNSGRVHDEDVACFVNRFGEILQTVFKPKDKYGLWYGVRKYRVKQRRDVEGKLVPIPNCLTLGPFRAMISYPGQVLR